MLMEICRMDVDRPDCKIMWEGGGGGYGRTCEMHGQLSIGGRKY